jgi:hypothetical protein
MSEYVSTVVYWRVWRIMKFAYVVEPLSRSHLARHQPLARRLVSVEQDYRMYAEAVWRR